MAKFNELGYEFHLICDSIRTLRKRYGSNNEIRTETNVYTEDLDKSYYLKGTESCRNFSMKLEGDYVER